jgi:ribonuclease D
VNRWSDRDPAAAKRLLAARASLAEISQKHSVPVENVLSPDLVRRIMWSPPEPRDLTTVTEALRAGGAREWQVELTAVVLTAAVTSA